MPVDVAAAFNEHEGATQMDAGRVTCAARRAFAKHTSRCDELLEIQLQRFQDASLSITIEARPKIDYAQPFLRILLPHLRRAVFLKAPYHILASLPLSKGLLERLTHIMIDYSQIKTYVHGMPAQPINQHTPIDIVAQEDGVLHLLHALPHLTTRSALYDWPKSRDEWINPNHIKSRCVGASGGVLDVGSAVTM